MAIKLTDSKLGKVLVKRNKLVPHLERAFNRFDGPLEFVYEAKEEDDAFHPSGHCTPCVTKLYEMAVGKLDPKDPYGTPSESPSGALRKIFLVGHFWHQVLQHLLVEDLGFANKDAIERLGEIGWGHTSVGTVRELKSGHRIPWAPFHWARGMADVAPCRIPGHGDWLVDFKTMNPQTFMQNLPTQYLEKWECQINIYMDWFDLEKALIVGINKSDGSFREFEFIRNQPLIDAIYHKWQIVSNCLDEDDVPHPMENPEFKFTGAVEL